MDSTKHPSHLRYAARSLFWAAASLACSISASFASTRALGVPPLPFWWLATALLVPLAHTGWVSRSPAADASWSNLRRTCWIGIGVCSVIDGTVAILEAGGPLAIADALYGAVLTAAGILLPRFALRHLALGVFGQEASTEGFRDRRGRQLMANAGVGLLLAGALMTIAVPNFLTFALRAKASETRGQIEAIRAAQERWYAEHGHYRASGPYPAGPPGLQRSEFDPVSHAASGFDQLGWPEEPDVSLYCRYAVNAPGPPQAADAYTIEAVCDLDGDGEWMAFGWVKPGPGENTGVAGPFGFCSVRGVVSRRGSTSTERVLDRYGPCDSTSSVSHF